MAKGLFETDALFWWIFDYMVFSYYKIMRKRQKEVLN